jgi:uncharacterized protein YjdB
VESIEIDPPAITLETGFEEELAAIIVPDNATYKDVRWKTDNAEIATVDGEGKVKGIAVGNTVIRAYSSNKLEAICNVTVIEHTHDWQEATCTEPKTCKKCGQTEGEVLGHEWGTPTYEWADDNSSVTAARVCIRDVSHIETETAYATTEEITPATCTEKGEAKFTATFENEAFEAQTKTADTDALGHDWDEGKVTKEATASQAGVKTYTCKTCKATKTEIIPMSGHKGKDGTAVGAGASYDVADKAITSMKSDNDPAGSKFAPLNLKSTKQGKNSIKLTWTKAKGATSYVVYGNKCGPKNRMKKLAAGKTNSCNVKKLKKGTYHKFIVVALDKNENVVSTSKVIHVATSGGKAGNHKSVKVTKKVVNKAKKLRKGKSLKLNAKSVAKSKKLKVKNHKAVRYESTNTNIAAVSNKGIVKAKNKGTCYVYAFAQNGVSRKIKVVVK